MKSKMSVKEMIEIYLEYGLDDETYQMLLSMRYHNLITERNWERFYDTVKSWRMTKCDDPRNGVLDGNDYLIYKYDENGFLVKC